MVFALGGRFLCWLPVICLAIAPVPLAAQPASVHRLGFLSPASPASFASRLEALQQGLRDLGYHEGKNLSIEYRWAQGNDNDVPALATDLLKRKVAIILIHGVQAAETVRKVGGTAIPMVCVNCGDVIGTGLVASLVRPGGTITGVTSMNPATSGKRLELLKEIAPGVSRIALLWNSRNPVSQPEVRETEAAARLLGLQVQSLGVSEAAQLKTAFSAMAAERAQAVVVLSDATFFAWRKEIAALAQAARIPSVAWAGELASAGVLFGYGPDGPAMARRAATFVDKILKGANPRELPMEQPTTFELVLNLKTARALNLVIPPSILLRASRVIE